MVKSEDGAEVWVDGGGGREEKARTQEERTVDGRSAYRDGRKKTLSVKRLSKKELVRGSYVVHLALAEGIPGRPLHRRECESGGRNAERPCPYVSCKHHLFLDVNQHSGSITMNFPDLELHELDETCALDVARENPSGVSLDKVAARMNLTRERVRQVETRAALRLRDSPDIQHLRDYLDTRDEGGGYDQTMPQERSAEGRTETRLSFPEIEERGREAAARGRRERAIAEHGAEHHVDQQRVEFVLGLAFGAVDTAHDLVAGEERRREQHARRHLAADMDHRLLLHRHRCGHHVRRLAHRQDHGPEDHQAQAGGRLLCRDRWRDDAVPGFGHGHPRLDDAHHHRRHRRGGRHAAGQRGALGHRRQHRLGLDLHHSRLGGGGRRRLPGQLEAVVTC